MANWTPASITTLAWYDANVSGSITIASGFVTAWADQSGNAKTLTPTSSSNLVYGATALSTSKPGITFDGTNGFTNASFGVAGGTKVSAFAAAQMNFSNIASYGRLVSVAASGQPDYNGASSGDIPLLREANSARVSTWGTTPTTDQTTNVAFLTAGMNYSTSAENRVNGTSQGAVSYTYGTFANDKLGIGYGVDGVGSPWGGVISEVIVIGTDPTANVTVNEGTFPLYQVVEGYLAFKWGLQGSLPGGHPFKSAQPTLGATTHNVSVTETAAATEAYVAALKIYPHWLKVAPRVSYSNLRNAGRSDLAGGVFHYSIFEKLRSTIYNDGPADSLATSDAMSGIKTNLVRITGGFGSFLNTDGVNWAGLTLRVRFETSVLAVNNGGEERVSFVFLAGTSGSIAAAYIGHAAASGDPYDFDGSQVQLKFDGGSTTKALSGAATVVSDYAPTFAYDPTKPLIVSIAFTGTQINLAGY